MHFWGMHVLWWGVWCAFLVWIFLLPWDIPGERRRAENPLDVLKRRYAKGEISTEEYEERRQVLEGARAGDHTGENV